MNVRFVIVIAFFLCGMTSAFAQEDLSAADVDAETTVAGSSTEKPELVYHDIPARWNYYFAAPQTLDAHRGEETRKVCFDDDLYKTQELFGDFSERVRGIGRDRRGQTFRYKLFQGGVHFIVVGEKQFLVRTPETGTHIVETKYCKEALDRAKYITFRSDAQRETPKRCMQRSKGFMFLTRYGTGKKFCEIESIHQWTGPFDSELLRSQGGTTSTTQDTSHE